jgi:hypothetical protein
MWKRFSVDKAPCLTIRHRWSLGLGWARRQLVLPPVRLDARCPALLLSKRGFSFSQARMLALGGAGRGQQTIDRTLSRLDK